MTTEAKRMGRPPEHGPRRNVTMALPIELVEAVDDLAAKQGKTRTAFVEQWLRYGLQQVDWSDGEAEASDQSAH